MSTVTIGRVRPYYRGDWSSSTAYTVMDRVTHDGHLFEAIADGTNHEPEVSGSAYWLAISVNGETPEPVWDGTKLSWEYPDGTTTQEVDLQGPKGDKGDKGDPATPLTSDLTSTATDVALTALGGNRLYNMISDTRTIVVSTPTNLLQNAPIGHSVSFNTSATSLLVPAQDIVKFYLSVPEIQISNTVFNATNDAATISFTTPAGVVEGTSLTVQLVAEDAVGNKSRVSSTTVTAVQGKVKAPTITVPAANAQVATNAVGVTITGSAFDTQYVSDTHKRSRFSICTDNQAQNVVAQYHSNTPETSHTFLVSELDEITVDDTQLYAYLRYEGEDLGWGELSEPQPFTAHFASVDAPTITAPTSGATAVTNLDGLTVTTSAFATSGAQDTQSALKIKITSDIGGLAVLVDKTVSSATNTYTFTTSELALLNNGTAYVWAAHVGTSLGQSAWSSAVAITVAKASVTTPTISTPASNADVFFSNGVTITLSSFAVTGAGTNTDTQASASYKITSDAAGETVVAQSLANTTDLTSHSFSASDVSSMVAGNTYYAWGKQAGTALGDSAWSTAVAFTAITGTQVRGCTIYRSANNIATTIEATDADGSPLKFEVIDAAYRNASKQFGTYGTDNPTLTNYSDYTGTNGGYYINDTTSYLSATADVPSEVTMSFLVSHFGAKLASDTSSKTNCDSWMTYNNTTDSQSIVGVPAVAYCRGITQDGGGWDLPREWILMILYMLAEEIDALDPTAAANPTLALGHNVNTSGRFVFAGANFAWSSTESSNNYCRYVYSSGGVGNGTKYYNGAAVPVRELNS